MHGPSMAMEWLLPTAAFVYLAKPYFESFLKEAGKDHYTLLKAGLTRLGSRLLDKKTPQVTMFHSDGKAKPSQEFSLTYSVLAELEGGVSAKLLIKTESSAEILEQATKAFLDFVRSYHNGVIDLSSVEAFESPEPVGRILLFALNEETGKLKVVDPIPMHVRKKQEKF